jgi:cyclopropane fatty-acyl-phospholipid synthase-like methyltransferase
MASGRGSRPPVALEERSVSDDQRMFSPSVARNSASILAVLQRTLPVGGRILEIGCGTGEHAVHFAGAVPNLVWQPSDPDSRSRASTAGWIEFSGLSNVLPPLDVDVCAPAWPEELATQFDVIVSLNMVHIAPWAASLGLFAGAEALLGRGGVLFLYGPFMRDGVHNAPSNADFDATLKRQDPSWGVRDIADLARVGQASGLNLRETIEMPANNTSLVFIKTAGGRY